MTVRGFTLIELMVTITIIAILSTVGLVVYSTVQKTARVSKRVQDLQALRTAIELFKSSVGSYPSVTTAGTFVCANALSGSNALTPTYMPTIPDDPSGSGYCYEYTSEGTGATPAGTDYKVRTNSTIPSTEMTSTDYKTQTGLIDPDKDGTADDACVVTTTGTSQTGWAYYTNSTAACNW